MEAHPPTVEDHMAVEATNESESAAALQNPAPGAMLTDEDLVGCACLGHGFMPTPHTLHVSVGGM